MSQRAVLSRLMPSMLRHEGVWEGTYRHLDAAAVMEDMHRVRIICEFPDAGPFAYIQRNHFIWADGREMRVELPGVLTGDRLHWDTPTFAGTAWEAGDGLILLNLARKDDPGANFFEIIAMGETGRSRARTWHWFKNGALFRRTLCDEVKVD